MKLTLSCQQSSEFAEVFNSLLKIILANRRKNLSLESLVSRCHTTLNSDLIDLESK